MRETHLTLPELGLIGATRAALGLGLGFLLADRLPADQRRAVGWTLFLVGALTTIPLAAEVFSGFCDHSSDEWPELASTGAAAGSHGQQFRSSAPARA